MLASAPCSSSPKCTAFTAASIRIVPVPSRAYVRSSSTSLPRHTTVSVRSSNEPWQPPGLSSAVRISKKAPPLANGPLVYRYHQLEFPMTAPGISLIDVTPQIRELISQAGLQEGSVNVLSRHTTTALVINENEARLLDDIRIYLSRLAPASDPYLHNDLHLRPAPEDWPGGWAPWAAQEPRNAHSHLLSLTLGNTLTLPITEGRLALGIWQSVLLVELDGPRPRTVGVQLTGYLAAA